MDSQSLPRSFNPPRKSVQAPFDTSAPIAFHNVNASDGDGSAPKKRRTSTTTSSRGVANLTPEQLAKKRANDREAQRAIRERTKTQIETLEKQVRDLKNQQPQQELQTVVKQKQLAEAENVQIKKKLTAALSLLQPLLGNQTGGAPSKNSTPGESA
ncbi:MAG: hypothetical protein L6R41_005588 [Letrouitia leprolyta]|nr:MAG: hypothetical protein L6R41_005588 [Letrouitia leprolyta]